MENTRETFHLPALTRARNTPSREGHLATQHTFCLRSCLVLLEGINQGSALQDTQLVHQADSRKSMQSLSATTEAAQVSVPLNIRLRLFAGCFTNSWISNWYARITNSDCSSSFCPAVFIKQFKTSYANLSQAIFDVPITAQILS